jgi:hypothetical protein
MIQVERRGEETIPHAEFKKGLKRHALSHHKKTTPTAFST